MQPGVGVDLGTSMTIQAKEAQPFSQTLINMIPTNPVKSMTEGNVLQIIVFALFFGISLNLTGKVGEPLIKVIDAIAEAMYKLTSIVMEFAPYGVFALMAYVAQQYGLVVYHFGESVICVYQVYNSCCCNFSVRSHSLCLNPLNSLKVLLMP